MDGALYGSILPVLKTFGDLNIMDLVNSFSICMHKFFGLAKPTGVVLTNETFDKFIFDSVTNKIEYLDMTDRLTITGTRSGHSAILSLKMLEVFNL